MVPIFRDSGTQTHDGHKNDTYWDISISFCTLVLMTAVAVLSRRPWYCVVRFIGHFFVAFLRRVFYIYLQAVGRQPCNILALAGYSRPHTMYYFHIYIYYTWYMHMLQLLVLNTPTAVTELFARW